MKCKYEHDDKKCETYGIKYKHCHCFLEYTNFKDDLMEYNVCVVTKIINTKFDEELQECFFNVASLAKWLSVPL